MRPEVRVAWTTALRSGEFTRGEGQLVQVDERREPVAYCCLGVLCALAVRAEVPVVVRHDVDRQARPYRTFDGAADYLPSSVMSWAGLYLDDPVVVDPNYPNAPVRLSRLNDGGASFEEIAAAIEGSL